MEAFGYQPRVTPSDYQYERPATLHQQRFLKAVRDNAELSQIGMQTLCKTILEGYGFADFSFNEGIAFVLVDWFKNAPNRSKTAAEKAAWNHL